MSLSSQKNVGSYLHAAPAAANDSIVAGGAGNGVLVTGLSVDRLVAGQNLPLSASILYAITATVAAGKTLTLSYSVQHSVDNSTWVDFQDPLNQVAATVEVTGTGAAQNVVVKQDVQLDGANEFVRVQFTPTLSATSIDVAAIAAVWVFGGMDVLP